MKSSVVTWVCRALWLALPITLGEVFSRSLAQGDTQFAMIWQIALWAMWVVVLGSTFVQLPQALTLIRICIPLAPVLGVGFALAIDSPNGVGVLGIVGIGQAAAVAVLVMSGDVGADFIDGPSYGDERRLGLRPPGFLMIGPLQLMWAITVGLPVATVSFAAAGKWVLAVIAVAISGPAVWYSSRLIHRLSRRCLVLVPAGLTLVDELSLAEPTLFRREDISRLGPAVVGSQATDLTVGASGLLVSVDFNRELSIVPAGVRGSATEATEANGILLALTRPGQLLDQAEERRIKVERR